MNSGADMFSIYWIRFYTRLDHWTHRLNAGVLSCRDGPTARVLGIGSKTWRFAIQHPPAAAVETSLHANSRFIGQMLCYYRSSLRHLLTCLLTTPG